jgi:hypothetical protein
LGLTQIRDLPNGHLGRGASVSQLGSSLFLQYPRLLKPDCLEIELDKKCRDDNQKHERAESKAISPICRMALVHECIDLSVVEKPY